MSSRTPRRETVPQAARWAIWITCLALWTLGLLRPEPITVSQEAIPSEAAFPLAKSLHVGVYAGLTLLGTWLALRGSGRWLLVGFLLLHGSLTEYLQSMVPMRTGSLRDVLLNGAGVLLGVACTWRYWKGERRTSAVAAPASYPRFTPPPIRRESA